MTPALAVHWFNSIPLASSQPNSLRSHILLLMPSPMVFPNSIQVPSKISRLSGCPGNRGCFIGRRFATHFKQPRNFKEQVFEAAFEGHTHCSTRVYLSNVQHIHTVVSTASICPQESNPIPISCSGIRRTPGENPDAGNNRCLENFLSLNSLYLSLPRHIDQAIHVIFSFQGSI